MKKYRVDYVGHFYIEVEGKSKKEIWNKIMNGEIEYDTEEFNGNEFKKSNISLISKKLNGD